MNVVEIVTNILKEILYIIETITNIWKNKKKK